MNFAFDNPIFTDAIIILGAAGIVIPAFARLRITPVIGFILVGVLLGPTGLGSLSGIIPPIAHITINNTENIHLIGEIGIILLLFSIGLELSFHRLWTMRQLVFGVGAAELLGSGFIIAALLYLFNQQWAASLGLGLALALSSTALVLPMSGTRSPVGRAALAMLLFEDVAIVPIIFLLGAIGPAALNANSLNELGATLLYGGLVIGGLLIIGRFLLPILFAQAARTKSTDLFMSVTLLVIILASLATSAVGLSPIVGALLAGLLIAETHYHGEVEVIIEPFKGLALGVFLISVGIQLDLYMIVENWGSLVAAIIGVVLIKALVTGTLLRFSGARVGTSIEAGILMGSPSETTLIVLAAASNALLIDAQTAAFWELVTAIGLTITPLLARLGHWTALRMEWRNLDFSLENSKIMDSGQVVVFGYGRVGRIITAMLEQHNCPSLIVDNDVDAVAAARRAGISAVFGNIARTDMLDKLRLGHARALVITMDDPVLEVDIVQRVRGWVPTLPIIARARDIGHAEDLYRAGATIAIPETLEASFQLSEAILIESGVPMGPVIASIHEMRDDMHARLKASAANSYASSAHISPAHDDVDPPDEDGRIAEDAV